jgi:DNA-binding transcriptional LysR family regulator
MDLKRLRTFVTVAELGSVSSAAVQLRITQPALSRQLRDLQADLGVRLFDLVGRRLRLTSAGNELLPHCHALLRHAEAVVERAQALIKADGGVLRVGATQHTIASVFSGFLGLYAARNPQVRVQPVEAGGMAQLEMLRRGDLHAAVTVTQGAETGFVAHELPPLRVLAAYRPQARFDLSASLDMRELPGLPLLLLTRAFGTRQKFDAACRIERVSPDIFLESSSAETLLEMARAGHGVAIVPSSAPIDQRSLRLIPLTFRGQALLVELAVVWDAQRPMPRYAAGFSAALGEYMRAVLPTGQPAEVPHIRRSGAHSVA